MRRIVSTLLILLVSSMAMEAGTRASTARSGSQGKTVSANGKKSTPKSASGKKASSRKAVAKGKGKSRTTRVARAPRQSAPTPERYMEIQQALAAKGYYTGEVNGHWGPESVQALKRFQADQKLNADGKLGALSLIALGLGPKHEPISQLTAKPESIP